MCGEIPNGHWAKDVVLHFTVGNSLALLNLDTTLDHIVEIRVNEICVEEPNGGTISPNMWRVQLGPNLETNEASNAGGYGWAFNIDDAVVTHTVFDRPRVITLNNRGKLNIINARMFSIDENNRVTNATFKSATLHLTFVMKKALWVPEVFLEEDRTFPLNARGEKSTKATF